MWHKVDPFYLLMVRDNDQDMCECVEDGDIWSSLQEDGPNIHSLKRTGNWLQLFLESCPRKKGALRSKCFICITLRLRFCLKLSNLLRPQSRDIQNVNIVQTNIKVNWRHEATEEIYLSKVKCRTFQNHYVHYKHRFSVPFLKISTLNSPEWTPSYITLTQILIVRRLLD